MSLYSDLPPSDPPDDSSQLDFWEAPRDILDHNIWTETSDDIPLQDIFRGTHHSSEYQVDAPLTRLRRGHRRSSSLPLLAARLDPSSDNILYTPRTERKLQSAMTQARRIETTAKNRVIREEREREKAAEEVKNKEQAFRDILDDLHNSGYTLAEFLDFVFNPKTRHTYDWRWKGFFSHRDTVERILTYWTSSSYSKSTRLLIENWVTKQFQQLARQESTQITKSGLLMKTNRAINEAFFLNYSLHDLTKRLQHLAPNFFAVIEAFSSTTRQKALSAKWLAKKTLMQGSAILALLKSKSQNNSYSQAVHGTYLMATGAQRQHFTVLSSLGLSLSYSGIIGQGSTKQNEESNRKNNVKDSEGHPHPKRRTAGTLLQLSDACRNTARQVASSGLFVIVYDNINMMVRVAEQVLGRKNAQENGTCATVIPLYSTVLEDLSAKVYKDGIINAPPLTLENLELTTEESLLLNDALVHAISAIIVRFGGEGFEKWNDDMQKSKPWSSERIEVHQTPLHPLPAMEIDENLITGNVEVVETIFSELRLDTGAPEFTNHVRIFAGDQLTISRQRSILNVRVGHEVGIHAWKHIVLMPGLFHAKIADCHGLLNVHFGKASARSPGSLAFHNTCLDRLPIVLSSLPPFRVCRDLIMVSLYARILHCLLLVSGHKSLNEYISKVHDWSSIQKHSQQILDQFANADRVYNLREPRNADARQQVAAKKQDPAVEIHHPITEIAGDMVFENACLFLRDSLLTRLFSDAIKAGDSGLVILVLKLWCFAYRGSGRAKYAHEMLHLLHNLINVWSQELRHVIVQNWLLNPTGKKDAFVEIDLVQEHLNFWIKKIYKADGDAHSWDWLALISPCVDVLRRLASKIHNDLGSRQGSKHSTPDIGKDITVLMNSLTEHEVYTVKLGRTLDAEDSPVPDVISAGLASLSLGKSSNPLAEFNFQYERMRERRQLIPISDFVDEVAYTSSPINDVDFAAQGLSDSDDDMPELIIPPSPTSSNSDDDVDCPSDDNLFEDSPTLTRLDQFDVALDMDDWCLDEDYGSSSSDEEDADEPGESLS